MPSRVVKPKHHQTGKTNKKRDKPRKAMKPGYRVSKRGKRYYEGRANRSDLKNNV